MAKFLTRIGADKMYCSIQLEIQQINLKVSQPMHLYVAWTRGPQKDESSKFEVNPNESTYAVNQKFSKTSHFFREKDGSIQKKTCSIELLSAWPSRKSCGSVEFDLGTVLGKGSVTRNLKLQNVVEDIQITAVFRVSELSKEEAAKAEAEDSKLGKAFGKVGGAIGGVVGGAKDGIVGVFQDGAAGLLEEASSMKKQVQELEGQIENYKSQADLVETLTGQLAELKEKIEEEQGTVQELTEKLEEAKSALGAAGGETEEGAGEDQADQQLLEDLQREVGQQEATKTSQDEKHGELSKRSEQNRDEIEQLKAKVQSLKEQSEGNASAASAQANKLMQLKKQCEDKQAQQNEKREGHQVLVEKIEAGKAESAVLTATASQMTQQLDSFDGKQSQLGSEGAALESELAELKRQAEAATAQSMEGAGYDCY